MTQEEFKNECSIFLDKTNPDLAVILAFKDGHLNCMSCNGSPAQLVHMLETALKMFQDADIEMQNEIVKSSQEKFKDGQ